MKLISVLLCLLLAECGPAFLPEPTNEKVTRKDLVGSWEYFADYQKTRIVLDLKANGTFIQTIERPSDPKPQIQRGRWDLKDSELRIKLLKINPENRSGPWILDWAHWWIVESTKGGSNFAISGAADDSDPDNCFEFDRIQSIK
ncbi:hypothetical protein [Leptospira adleri]|uniref:Lipoprotein n=1 Tax=Leptospira adleri TaxID=2023186 RepID=A0A2M9YQ93_9LEPT|nr:hypothetical protein [Leptospira adleri]PJZ53713.1 hypothetical protein CH380_09005 [Leptospira adleri]PJZ61263.1 hypothetical protein CH376_14235 [Leptospira adleri]